VKFAKIHTGYVRNLFWKLKIGLRKQSTTEAQNGTFSGNGACLPELEVPMYIVGGRMSKSVILGLIVALALVGCKEKGGDAPANVPIDGVVNASVGTIWTTGAASSLSNSQGKDGDLFLDKTTGDVYKKTSGVWVVTTTNLKGPAGSSGSGSGNILQTNNPTSAQCPSGGLIVTLFTDANGSGDYTSGETVISQNVICNGADGIAGANGNNGNGWLAGLASGLSSSLGSLKDFFLDETGKVWQKLAGGWTDSGINIKGQAGANGANGGNGTNGVNGAAGSNGTNGINGQTPQVDISAATVAQCSAGGYVYKFYVDSNNNNTYEAGTDTLTGNSVICNGASGTSGANGLNGTSGLNGSSPSVETFSATTTQCSAGGNVYKFYFDVNSNATFDAGTDTLLNTSVVCNGVAGANGTNGSNGLNGSNGASGVDGKAALVSTSSATVAQCANGGSVFRFYLDLNNNSSYDTGSDTLLDSSTVCNGSNGSNGAAGANGSNGSNGVDGKNPLSSVSTATVAQCPAGGNVYRFYFDLNSNNSFDAGSDTLLSASVVCNGSDGAAGANGINGVNGLNGSNGTNGANTVSKTSSAGAGDCANGGIIVETWTDSNNNGLYDLGTDTSYNRGVVCNGAAGTSGSAGANGTNGTNGVNGVNGSTWYTGSGAPSASTGVNGDFYLDTASTAVYKKASGSWSVIITALSRTQTTCLDSGTCSGSYTFAGLTVSGTFSAPANSISASSINNGSGRFLESSGDLNVNGTFTSNYSIVSGSYNCGASPSASTSIDWKYGNTQCTSANAGAITFTNMADGGAYTLIITGFTTPGTYTFSHSGTTFKTNGGPITSATGFDLLVSCTRVGSRLICSWSNY
jgi:hypothetical protein